MPSRVLIVEDLPALRRSYAITLQTNGHTVFQAWDIEAAFEMARLAIPDVLVIDERLIGANPMAFRWMTAHPRFRGVLVVVLSAGLDGRAEVDRRTALTALGAHAVIARPATEHDLVAAVRWVLDVYRLQGVRLEAG